MMDLPSVDDSYGCLGTGCRYLRMRDRSVSVHRHDIMFSGTRDGPISVELKVIQRLPRRQKT